MGSTTEHRATVCITADFDALSIWMNWGARGARALSRGEFGAQVGAPRLLELLARYELPSTWFVPGHTAETFPEITREVAQRGHEIANHGYHHEAFLDHSLDECREILRRANAAIERVTGQVPRGFRHPTGDLPDELPTILLEEGFAYDSSLAASDFHPYWCRGRYRHQRFGPSIPGARIDLVEVPHSFVVNDFHHFEFNYGDPALTGRDPPSVVEEIWRSQFDYMYEHESGGTLNVVLHPQSIGQGLRIAMLERFIVHCLESPATRFTTLERVAEEFRSRHAFDAQPPDLRPVEAET
jgi:peptidoglycan/xylan/chitin deacetylase (PgdA/CDA1 family)